MKKILVKSRKENYSILVGSGLLKKSGRILASLGLKGKVMIVSQDLIAQHHLQTVLKSLNLAGYKTFCHMLPQGEEGKSQEQLFRLVNNLMDNDFERRDTVLALGGGVVGDLSGFAAACYLRGISFINVGTTLLAQVDSSIGGKTGINLPQGKNLMGAFNPGRVVISDVDTLKTLPDRELKSSLAEVIKYGVIKDLKLFSYLDSNSGKILGKSSVMLEKIVIASATIKAGVVSRDEFETKGERMILNFGHTFAHGFEKALGYKKLMHGEAVAVGMVCASHMAARLGMISEKVALKVNQLIAKYQLPVSVASFQLTANEIMEAMQRDKKKNAGMLRFVLPVKIGKVVVREDIPEKLIREILVKVGAKP